MEQTENVATIVVEGENESEELIRCLLKKGILELKPTLDKVGVHYVEAEDVWGVDSSGVKVLLDDLAKKDLLKLEFLDRILTCPQCGSPEVHSRYACPRCKSDNVEFTELLEHKKCGSIGPKNTFLKGSSLFCPRCQDLLVEGSQDYRIVGNFFQCEKCAYRFDRPDVVHVCMNCGTTSTHQTAKYIKIFRYRIRDEIVRKLQEELPILKNLEKLLTERGFRVQIHAKVKGALGAESVFDIVVEKNGTRLVIDVSVTGDKNDIIGLLAKKIDVNPTDAVIMDLSASDELPRLGKVYDIVVFKIAANQAVPNDFEKFLGMFESLLPKVPRNAWEWYK